jgi:hypothetical protein
MDDNNNSVLKKPVKSSALKASGKTFFFDVYVASNEKRYLKVTESRLIKDGDQQRSQRNSFILFPEDLQNFQLRLTEISGDLAV